jgi:hypothetical protein
MSSPPAAVTAVLAALEAGKVNVRALDVGRAGLRDGGAVERMMRAVVGEIAERRLLREWALNPPDVAVAFDPFTCAALASARHESPRSAPVIGVVAELAPAAEWGSVAADRFLVVDEAAGAALGESGVPDDRIVVIGPLAEARFVAAAAAEPTALRERFKLPAAGPVVLVEVAGLQEELAGQVALQLSLVETRATYLFAAGGDGVVAAALRAIVPTLDLRAKLFGDTEDAPLLWRSADVVVVRPRERAISRALVTGARVVTFLCEGDAGAELGSALAQRGLGAVAASPLLISSALNSLLHQSPLRAVSPLDGAGNAADVIWLCGMERQALVAEADAAERAHTSDRVASASRAADRAARARAAPGELEDLSGNREEVSRGAEPDETGPDPEEVTRLRAQLTARRDRLQRSLADAHRSIASWERRAKQAADDGSADGEIAREAERNADLERARMHSTLGELQQIDGELARLARAEAEHKRARSRRRPEPGVAPAERKTPRRPEGDPSVDDMLDQLKRQGSNPGRRGKSRSIEEELDALKRQAKQKPPKDTKR